MNIYTIICFVLLCFCVVYITYDNFFKKEEPEYTEEYIKYLNDCRNTVVNSIISEIAMRWQVDPQDLNVAINPSAHEATEVRVLNHEMAILMNINWKTNNIKITYLYDEKNFKLTSILRLHLRNGQFNYKRFRNWLIKQYDAVIAGSLNFVSIEQFLKDAIEMAKDKEIPDEDIRDLLFGSLKDFEIRKGKHYQQDCIQYTRLLAYALRFEPENFIKFCGENGLLPKKNDNND